MASGAAKARERAAARGMRSAWLAADRDGCGLDPGRHVCGGGLARITAARAVGGGGLLWLAVIGLLAGCSRAPEPARQPAAINRAPPPSACARAPMPAASPRPVVIARPWGRRAAATSRYELLRLSESGLASTGTTFNMGRAPSGRIVWSPDGELGFVAQEDGTVGWFRRTGDGVQVQESAWRGPGWYARAVVGHPQGEGLWVVDARPREQGGGLHYLRYTCEGGVEWVERVPLDRTKAWAPLARPGEGVWAGWSWGAGHLHWWRRGGAVAGEPGAELVGFDPAPAEVAGFALTPDQRFVLVGDNNELHDTSRRVLIAELAGGHLYKVRVIRDVGDPVALLASPLLDGVLAVDGYGGRYWRIPYDPGDVEAPFGDPEPVQVRSSPQLPSSAVLVERGPMAGTVLAAELNGVRVMRFVPGGIEDVGFWSEGAPLERMVGAIGVVP